MRRWIDIISEIDINNGDWTHGKLVDYWDANGNHISQREYELSRLSEKLDNINVKQYNK